MIEQRDLLIVPFPFSDQSGKKIRPVIVISRNSFNSHSEDVIVLGVTSNLARERYSVSLTNKDLEEGNLFTDCVVKVENILRLEKSLIIKKIGKVNEKKINEIFLLLNNIIG